MTNSTTLLIRIEKDLKIQARITANAIGIPLSTLIHAFLKEFVASGKVEFSATTKTPKQFKHIMKEVRSVVPRKDPVGPVGPLTPEQAEAYMKELFAAYE